MSLSKMKLLNLIGRLEDLDDTVMVLGKSGVFQPDETAEFFSNNENLIPISSVNDFSPILDKLSELMNESGIKAQIVDSQQYDEADFETIESIVNELDSTLGEQVRERSRLDEELSDVEQKINSTKHFLDLDIDINDISACEYIVTRFGKLPEDSYKKLLSYDENPYVEFFPCSHDSDYYWGVYVTPIEEVQKIDRIFSRLYFEETDITGMEGTPKKYLKKLEEQKKTLSQAKQSEEDRIKTYIKEHRQKILRIFSALCKHHAYLSIKNHACKYHQSYVLVGWVPAEYAGMIKKSLKSIKSVEVTITDASEETKHSPPVKLKNRFFFKPFEYYTDMYGLPNYREIDPSWFIALTYTLLFGIMFADVGQGFLLLFAAIYMYTVKKMPLGRLLIPCSICSVIFGFIFGSVFGFEELLTPLHRMIFGTKDKLLDVLEGNTTMLLIYSAVAVGIILLMIAMLLNIISCFKRGDIGGALFGVNGVSGLVFYASLLIGLVCTLVLNINVMTTAYTLGLIVLPLILIFLREPLSKLIRGERKIFGEGIGSFIVDNLFEMFEVALSYVTNTMSFLRVGAFVLVHAGMMKVVFVLAEMFDPIGYVITLIVGNILVMVLEALLVGIQVLRLEYYELFSRFYIGDGRKYEPVNVDQLS